MRGAVANEWTANEWPEEEGSGVRAISPDARSGYTRVRYVLESRSAVLELRAASPDAPGPLAPLPDARRTDVMDPNLETLPHRTFAVSACPMCAGAGDDCVLCLGCGRVEAWVFVRVLREYRVRVHGEGPARERHHGVADPADFERSEFPNTLVHQAWYRSVPSQLAANLRVTLAPHERVQFVQVQVFVG